MRFLISTLAVLFALNNAECKTNARIVCYFSSWAVYRPSIGQYGTENIPMDQCTHLIYAFAGINGNTNEIQINDSEVDVNNNGFLNFTSLKSTHPHIKYTVAVGDRNDGGAKFSNMVSTTSSRKTFVDSAIAFLNLYKLDGLDLSWSYPGDTVRDGVTQNKEDFLQLARELRKAFTDAGKDWELTAAVPLIKSKLDAGFSVAGLCKVLNAVHVMGWGLHGNWDGVADIHSQLYRRIRDTGDNIHRNVNDGMKLLETEGCPANKLVLGVPFFGQSYTLSSASNNAIGAPINKSAGGGDPGPYTQNRGTLAYYEICSDKNWTMRWDMYGMTAYAFNGNQWVGFENSESVNVKMLLVKMRKYLGAAIWSIDMDDFGGLCGPRNQLISIIKSQLSTHTVNDPVYEAPHTTNRSG